MMLDTALLQYHIFKNLESSLKKQFGDGTSFRAASSIRPESNLFTDIDNFSVYVKYIQSTYRVDLDGRLFYFFFRNKKNRDGSFTLPSSIEIVEISNCSSQKVLKYHYFKDTSGDFILNQSPYYSDDASGLSEMRVDIKVISDFIVTQFLSNI